MNNLTLRKKQDLIEYGIYYNELTSKKEVKKPS